MYKANKICAQCVRKECEFRHKAFKNMAIFCNDNCAKELHDDAKEILPQLQRIVKECKDKPGFRGLVTQAECLMNAANKVMND